MNEKQKKELQTFKDKETSLKKAIERVNNLLEGYKIKAPEGDKWNQTHDLEDRLRNRLIENWKEFKIWHWDNFQFNTY